MLSKNKYIILVFLVFNQDLVFGQINNCDSMNYKFLNCVKKSLENTIKINGLGSTIFSYDNTYNVCFEKKKKYGEDAESFYVDYKNADSIFFFEDKKNDSTFARIQRGVELDEFINSIKPWSYKLANGCNFATGNYTHIYIQCPFVNWEEFYSNALFSDTLILSTNVTIFYRKNTNIVMRREYWNLRYINNRFVVYDKKNIFYKKYVCTPATQSNGGNVFN